MNRGTLHPHNPYGAWTCRRLRTHSLDVSNRVLAALFILLINLHNGYLSSFIIKNCLLFLFLDSHGDIGVIFDFPFQHYSEMCASSRTHNFKKVVYKCHKSHYQKLITLTWFIMLGSLIKLKVLYIQCQRWRNNIYSVQTGAIKQVTGNCKSKSGYILFAATLPNVNRFQFFFTERLDRKFATESSLNITPYLNTSLHYFVNYLAPFWLTVTIGLSFWATL